MLRNFGTLFSKQGSQLILDSSSSNLKLSRCLLSSKIGSETPPSSPGKPKQLSSYPAVAQRYMPRKGVQRLMEVPEERKIDVTLLNENGIELGVMRKSAARNLAFNKDLVLTEIIPTSEGSSRLEVCQLMTPAQSREFQNKAREQRKAERLSQDTGESLARLSDDMGEKHFEAKLKQIQEWLKKRKIVKLQIVLNNVDSIDKLETMKSTIFAALKQKGTISEEKKREKSIHFTISPILNNKSG